MKYMTLQAMAEACRGVYIGNPEDIKKEAISITTDSRKAERGGVFAAIKGERVDGHDFIPGVLKAGALCLISEKQPVTEQGNYIIVEDTVRALGAIAGYYRKQLAIPVVGITGSVGKTSTKEMIASVLSQKYCVHKTLGNFNNEWGLPITIFEMNEKHQVAVLEMGVNHFGEMRRLSSVASPDICVITNIGIAHLEFFTTREGILQEKSQMIQDMKTGGSILLNGDDDLLRDMGPVKGVDPEFFGLGKNCQFYATDVESLGLRGSSCTIHLPSGESFDCIVPLPGAHMVQNALAGTAVGYQLGLTPAEIKAGIEGLPSIPGRNNIIQTDKIIILDDCYNANPISMQASLDVLNMAIGRKVAVLGDMGELGETGKELHYETGAHAGDIGIDLVCGIGELSKELVAGASEHGCEAKWFPAKASHGMQFPEIVDELQKF